MRYYPFMQDSTAQFMLADYGANIGWDDQGRVWFRFPSEESHKRFIKEWEKKKAAQARATV